LLFSGEWCINTSESDSSKNNNALITKLEYIFFQSPIAIITQVMNLKKQLVLHVDDNEYDLQLVKISLSTRAPDLEIVQADSVSKALDLFEQQPPHCVLSDYQMPGRDGLDFLKTIRSNKKSTPFIFLTGQGNEELAIEALRSGADDYFSKEEGFAHYERLINSLRRLCELSAQRAQRREMQHKLEVSEERFRLASRAAGDLIFEWMPGDGTLKWFGDVYSLLGRTPEELGSTAEEYVRYIHPEDVHLAIDVIGSRVTSTEPFFLEYRIQKKNGDYSCFAVRGLPIVDDESKPVKWVGACTDITDQRQYEEKLEFQADLLDSIHDSIIATDKEGYINYANAASCEILKREKKDIVGQHVVSLGEDVNQGVTQQEILEKTLADGTWSGDVVNKTAEGESVILRCRTKCIRDELGEAVGLVGISSNVTDERRRSMTFEAMASIIEHLDEMALVKDLNNRILAANQKYASTIGFSDVNDIIGKTEEELLPPDIDNSIISNIDKQHEAVRSMPPGRVLEREEDFAGADGRLHRYRIKRFAVYNRNDQMIGTAAICKFLH
jgi:PAS domain S-box-containing protein